MSSAHCLSLSRLLNLYCLSPSHTVATPCSVTHTTLRSRYRLHCSHDIAAPIDHVLLNQQSCCSRMLGEQTYKRLVFHSHATQLIFANSTKLCYTRRTHARKPANFTPYCTAHTNLPVPHSATCTAPSTSLQALTHTRVTQLPDPLLTDTTTMIINTAANITIRAIIFQYRAQNFCLTLRALA